MKPKVFIGSSVEGLSTAYAIHQNLSHDAEVTVWSQGAFELSSTTIESLVEITETSDFGVFVFTPDDIITIRDNTQSSVRDNVIFELGLFIGKLGRKRTFIVIPDKTELHIPTDLLGVTPGKYDPKRSDKNLQAATGPVCNEIRNQVKKLGFLNPILEPPLESIKEENDKINEESPSDWLDLFVKKEYLEAKVLLEREIESEPDPNINLFNQAWKLYCEFMINEGEALNNIETFLNDNKDSPKTFELIASFLSWEDYFNKAMETVERGLSLFNDNAPLAIAKAACLERQGDIDGAIESLVTHKHSDSEQISLKLAQLYEEQSDLGKAREAIHKAYVKKPKSEEICYQYARICLNLSENEVALFILARLTNQFPENTSYWGYLSNACASLNMPDRALAYAKKADTLAEGKGAWIQGNIGNIFNNRGLPSVAVEHLKRSLELNNDSDYAHDRLSSAIKSQEEEQKKLEDFIKEGRRKIREVNFEKSDADDDIF